MEVCTRDANARENCESSKKTMGRRLCQNYKKDYIYKINVERHLNKCEATFINVGQHL